MKLLPSWSFVRCARRFLSSPLVSLALAGSLHAANGVGWNSIDLPPAAVTGQTIWFSANVTNSGTTAWNAAYFLELLDANGTPQNYPSVNGTASGATANPTFTLTLPPVAGTYTYRFTAMENGVEYFGGVQTRTIVVTPAPALFLSPLTLSPTTVASGDTALATSTAGVAGETIYHGLEGRPTGGTWQNWMVWNGAGGATQTAPVGPATPGTYEVRAYAARPNASGFYSNSITLTVVPSVAVSATQSVDSLAFTLANGTGIRSTAFPAGQITYHGIETRRNGGAWQNWGVWNDSGGLEQTKYRTPTASGTYEVRAYTARANMASNYSPSSFIAVAAQPGALAPVTILQESRRVNWEEEQDEFGGTGNYSSTMESHPFILNAGGILQIHTTGETNTTAWLVSTISGVGAEASGGGVGGNFSLTFTAPGPGNYYVCVWREDDTGSGDYDLTVSFTPTEQILPLPGAVLAKPQALPATAANTGGFTANWDGVPGVARFRLDVATDNLFSSVSILPAWNNVDVSNTLSFIVTGLTSGVSYFYRVRAINKDGLPSPSSEPVPAAPLGAPPPPPNLGAATAITTGGFTANWTAIPGVAGYVIDLSQELNFATLVGGWSGVGAGGPTATSKSVTGLAGGTTYYYRVRAFNAIGLGPNSLPGTLTTLPVSAGPSASVNPGTGLAVEYFSDLTLSQPAGTGTGAQIDDYDDNGDSEEQSSRRYTGFVRPYNSGPLTFVLNVDDGARLWINNQLLIDAWTQGGGQTSATLSLSAGQLYALKLEFFQNGGERRVQLQWQGGGQASEVIPASRLYPPGTPQNLPVIGGLNMAGGTLGVAFSAQLVASGSPTGYTVSGPLPSGLVFNPTTGAITGTPTQTGTFRLTVQATNALGAGTPAPLTLTIDKATPVLTVKNESVDDQDYLPIAQAMIPVNAVAPAAGLPAPTGTIRYTAYRVIIPQIIHDPLTPVTFGAGLRQVDRQLSVTATYLGDANYLPATNTVIFENRDTLPPVFPVDGVGLTQLLLAPTSASFRWNAATDASAGVLYDISVNGGASVYAGAGGLTTPEAVLKNLTASTAYQVVLRARDTLGNPPGPWSAPLTVSTPAAPPTASTGSTWRDLNGDGLDDEIIPNEVTPTSSTRFHYFTLPEAAREVSFTEWQEIFIYVPGFSYVSANRNYRDTTDISGPRILVYDQFIPVGIETVTARLFAQVMPVFQFVAEPGYKYSVNRELTRSDGAKLYPRIFTPTLWELLGSVATVHEWSPGGPWLDDSYGAFPHVLVRYSEPIGSVSLAGQFAAVTVGTARGLGGILTVPFPATGNVVISLKDLANEVLKAGPKVVWEVWDGINQIRVGTSTVGDLLDIGINTSGEFQVGLKLDDSTKVWFNVSVQLPPAPKLAVDANRDGTITFDAADGTSMAAHYRFWLNDDIDRLHTFQDSAADSMATVSETEEDDIGPAEASQFSWQADYLDGRIESKRDLEDFSRLWINTQGLNAAFKRGDLKLGLKWTDTASTTPAIQLYESVEADGGLGYLTVDAIAANQLLLKRNAINLINTTTGYAATQISGTGTFILPTSLFDNLSDTQPKTYLLFEACALGKGQLKLVILKLGNGSTYTEIAEGSGVWMDLKKIGDMYEHWSVGNASGGAPNTIAARVPSLTGSGVAFSYDIPTPSPEERKYILFVHGWNMEQWDKERFAETAFKRLWWQGYKGRFGLFSWPCTNLFDETSTLGKIIEGISDGTHFDRGEWSAWRSGTPLRQLLQSLNGGYGGQLYTFSHSMGGIVMSEALRLQSDMGGGQIANVYVASQAALSAHLYDGTLSTAVGSASSVQWEYIHPKLPIGSQNYGPQTTNVYRNWLAYLLNGSATSSKAVGTLVNFYNQNDWALAAPIWQFNQITKPDWRDVFHSQPYKYVYTGDPAFFADTFSKRSGEVVFPLALGTRAGPQDRYEIMAFAAESHVKSVGATPNVSQGVSRPFDVRTIWDLDGGDHKAHIWHSAQFRSTMAKQKGYWNALLGQPGFQIPTLVLP